MAIGAVTVVGLASSLSEFGDKKDQPEKYVTIALEDQGFIGNLYVTLDLVERIDIKYPTKVSKKPTSRGRKTDNIHNEPVILSIKGLVSNASVSILDMNKTGSRLIALATQFTDFDPYLEGVAVQAAMALLDLPKASQEAYQKLLEIRDTKSTVSISTSLGTFKGLIIESIDIPISYEVGDALEVNIKATAIPFVQTTSALIDVSNVDKEAAGTTGVDSTSDLGSGTMTQSSIGAEAFDFFSG